MKRAQTLALAPLLAAQAIGVILRAERLPEPEGPRDGQSGQGVPLRVLILGDSSAAGVGVAHQSQALSGQLAHRLSRRHALKWRLIAKSGITSKGALKMARDASAGAFDLAITALGVNDATWFRTPERFGADQRQLHEVLKERFGIKRHLICAVPPMDKFELLPSPLSAALGARAEAMDAELRQFAQTSPGVTHLPFDEDLGLEMMAQDGFHPSAQLYALWAERLAAAI